jgi:hypothetical protein
MKRLLIIVAVIISSFLGPTNPVSGQGTVRFDNNIPGIVVTHVYQSWTIDPPLERNGNGPNDYPPGNTDWSRWGDPVQGHGYSAQLWAAPSAGGVLQPESSLQPAEPTTTFQPAPVTGFVVPTTAVLRGVPAGAPAATIQLRAWDNKGGTVTTWEQATAMGVPRGASPLFNVLDIGGGVNPPPALAGLVSFNLAYAPIIPEPSCMTMVGVGLLILLARRRAGNSGGGKSGGD